MKYISVHQEELIAVRGDDSTTLTAGGVTTCICIMVKGTVGSLPCIAMYHWDGFPVAHEIANDQNMIRQVFMAISQAMILAMRAYLPHTKKLKLPVLEALYLIGGERATPDLSGTEREVSALKAYAQTACELFFITSVDTAYHADHYLTQNSEVIRVFFSYQTTTYAFDESFVSDDESKLDDDASHQSDSCSSRGPS
jgi:hypothetical protein